MRYCVCRIVERQVYHPTARAQGSGNTAQQDETRPMLTVVFDIGRQSINIAIEQNEAGR